MNVKSHSPIQRVLSLLILGGLLILFYFGADGSAVVHAQAGDQPNNPYFTSSVVTLADGTQLDEYVINGPPQPPPGSERPTVSLPESDAALGTVTIIVPAFNWSFGCSATSGSMIASYYDRNGYPNMYTGPTNGGVMPLDNSSWPSWMDGNGDTYGQCPLTASHNGLDGRSTRGSIDDYWVAYDSTAQDPYLANGWVQHTWGDAIGDYMKTSQYAYNNRDGSTTFWTYNTNPGQLTCSDMVSSGITNDGTVGRKLFYEAKGYTVTDCYNQKTDNNGGGFTFAMYKAEIDAGRPIMINLEGHTIVGVGYDSSTNTVYIHDTWDYATHTMTWGGSYSDMDLLSVSIVNLTTLTPPQGFNKASPSNGATGQSTSLALSWGSSGGATSYEYCYDTSNDNACSSWVSTGATTSANLSGLSANTSYYWQVRANNASGTTYADGSNTAYWSFTTGTNPPPGAFNKTSPSNGATSQSTSLALSWGSSGGATSYEYCYDTSNDNTCSSWVSTGATASANLSGLSPNTTYYWQVRANNAGGSTYADANTWWSFITNLETYTISGNTGVGGATLRYTDGTPRAATADGSGLYSFTVSPGWTGTVTPSKTGYTFSPSNRSYASVFTNQTAQNYIATSLASLIQDPSFEASMGSTLYWAQASTNFGTPLCTIAICGNGGGTGGPRSGSTWGWFGGVPKNETATLSQTIIIPNDVPNLKLQFYFWIGAAGVGSDAADVFTAKIDAVTVFSANATQKSSYPTYTLMTVDVSAFADGAPHTIIFSSKTTAQLVTFNLDDVALTNVPFFDVPVDYWANSFIERLYAAGITGGCSLSPLMYCPEVNVNRAQMAVFLLRGEHGSAYVPPAVGSGTGFTDVPADHWAAAWIKQLALEGITSGCGPSLYCPETSVTRDQMAVFLLRAEHGASYTPPPAAGAFTDVPTTHWAAPWIEQLAIEGITGGCGADTYCPSTPVTRAQMAVFLVRAFGLP